MASGAENGMDMKEKTTEIYKSGLVCGLEDVFFHILGTVSPTDSSILKRVGNHQPVML